MKIGIISDAHLFHRNSQIDVFKNLIYDLQNKVDIIIDCGDILDKNILNSRQAFELFNIFKDINVPYHIVKGNHDALDGVSLASLLPMNKNITVHNTIDFAFYNNLELLFVPYTDNIIELFKHLQTVVKKQVKYVFSHLNITNNLYASLPFSKARKLFLYGDVWFNGHIHTPEKFTSIEGTIYNVGSVSSLTFGDEHIPEYHIFDTDTENLISYPIHKSIIHKTVDSSEFDIEAFSKLNNTMYINWRIKIPNTFNVEDRAKIKSFLLSLQNTKNIQFDYLKTEQNNIKIEKSKNNNKKPLMQQLIEQYNKNMNENISEHLIKELIFVENTISSN